MDLIELIPLLSLVIMLFIATFYDIRSHRIPNWLTFPAMATGLAFYTYTKGIPGLISSIEGLFLGIALFMPFYLAAGMGAGDVKLMGAVGGFLGMKGVFIASLGTALIGGIYAMILLAFHGYLMETLKRYGAILKIFVLTGRFTYLPPEKKEKMPILAYGVAIALGTLFSVARVVVMEKWQL
ncbi:MAG: A24 family peptidase [Candidatus Jettenia sp. CY-1]|nr:MAG: A24 family peptidase [Candidatus Jettenia sp. CY-1]